MQSPKKLRRGVISIYDLTHVIWIRWRFGNLFKLDDFLCHTDIFNYLFTYLTEEIFNTITSLHSLLFNPVAPKAPFLYPLKTSRGYRKGALGTNELKKLFIDYCLIYFFTDWLCSLAFRLKGQNLSRLWIDLICSKFWLSPQLHFFRDVQFLHRIVHVHFHHPRL